MKKHIIEHIAADSIDPDVLLKTLVAYKNGDFTVRLPNNITGLSGKIAHVLNDIFASTENRVQELERISENVGKKGKLNQRIVIKGTDRNLVGQSEVKGISPDANVEDTNKTLLDAQNEILKLKNTIITMVGQLSSFVDMEKNILDHVAADSIDPDKLIELLVAYKNGDFTVRLPANITGLNGKIADTLNDIIALNEFRVHELERICEVVGKQGKLNHRADISGIGSWKVTASSINSLIEDISRPTKEITRVISAVAKGDLTMSIPLEVGGEKLQGELLRSAFIVNTMVGQLNSSLNEVIRVAREVGTEGKLGEQARVEGVSGTWKDLTDSVNSMASNLTNQVRNIADVTIAVARGDLSHKITIDVHGEFLELKDTINTMVEQLRSFSSEVTRVAREVGTEGKLGEQAIVPGAAGVWKELTDNVNFMGSNLTRQVRNIADVTTAVAKGELNRKITVAADGEFLDLKNTINTMVDQLNAFASEVTRVAREVGTEGKLGGQAHIKGVSGIWKDLTENVNGMANNLTGQVRSIADITTAIAKGDLSKQIKIESKGEFLELKNTINTLVDQLNSFASEVTRVAREVGTDGKLGGQATVPYASGTWSELTYNVNQLASNLSTQVRAIGEVVTAVTKGDLTRSIQMDARGEVGELKNIINEMIRNLRETTITNSEQDWLKTNIAGFTLMLQGQRDLMAVAQLTLSELARLVNAQHGIFFISENINTAKPKLRILASYAFKNRKNLSGTYFYGEGIVGQCAIEKQQILINNVPDDYIRITSGLGEAPPINIIALPIIFEGTVKAVIELASLERFSDIHQTFLDQLSGTLGIIFNTIESGSRTEELLKQSQSLALELQSQQQELKQSNEDLEGKALLLSEQNAEVERKNKQIDIAHKALEEKAEQLALTSKYKSEFLSNMSHELRTPLNSLLILSQQLAENREGNLTEKQVKYAKTIRSSGNDLLFLINDILDLAKIESGTVTLDPTEVYVKNMCEEIERNFRHIAITKELKFTIKTEQNLPTTIYTDAQRVQQIIKNLLSNAFKFTAKGSVTFSITHAVTGWSSKSKALSEADMAIAFSVSDTGFGIPPSKLKIIFEVFQQADGNTSRGFGGTGLGLSISRELANLLGGEITVSSIPDKGSTFTLYLPVTYPQLGIPENLSPKNISIPDFVLKKESINTPKDVMFVEKSSSGNLVVEDTQEVLPHIKDDRNNILEDDKVIVIIEDDFPFAQILTELAHEKGFKVIAANSGEEGIKLVKQYLPVAVTLDIFLPDTEGWIVLDRLKLDRETRYIPVYVISVDDQRELSMHRGAFAHFIKPVTRETLEITLDKILNFIERETKKVLIVEEIPEDQNMIKELLNSGDVEITIAGSGEDALLLLEKEQFDCMILDLTLPGISGFTLVEIIKDHENMKDIPIIVYTTKELSKTEKKDLQKYAREIIIKDVRSPIRLLDEVNLFLHRKTKNIPEDKMEMLEKLYNSDIRLENKKALIVDDDIRNIFALTSVLERYNMDVLSAENGKDAIQVLTKNHNIDFVLMDIMMPEMDGYETMSYIRKKLKLTTIPIIALTAKAMKGDREKCILAGASDYISKPINTEQLLSLLRVWLFK